MSIHSSLDRESLQNVLANAYEVQESQMDPQSLSSVLEIQQLITSANLAIEAAAQLIADRTRSVANADGVAIGLMKDGNLVYRAGSGMSATNIGRRVSATFAGSTSNGIVREILRVENALTDKRMKASVCRQFGSDALLILLIHHEGAAAGVMEVHFCRPHGFEDREVRTYRLLAGLICEALANQSAGAKTIAAQVSKRPAGIEQITFQMKNGESSLSESQPSLPMMDPGLESFAADALPIAVQRPGAAASILQPIKSGS